MIPIRDSLRSTQTPHVVYALIAINVLAFLYQIALPKGAAELLISQYGLIPLRYSAPAWALEHGLSPTNYAPYITSIFMHSGLIHIIPNMWILFIFGSSLEARLGRAAFLLFYLICGVGANIVFTSFNPQSAHPAIGASGAVAGVIGAYAIAFPYARLVLLIPPLLFEAPAMAFAVFWFGLQIIEGAMELASPSMGSALAWWAHAGGFMIGMALAPFFPARRINTREKRRPDQDSPNSSGSPETQPPEQPAEGGPLREKEVSSQEPG